VKRHHATPGIQGCMHNACQPLKERQTHFLSQQILAIAPSSNRKLHHVSPSVLDIGARRKQVPRYLTISKADQKGEK
jgi:hypothetical protein